MNKHYTYELTLKNGQRYIGVRTARKNSDYQPSLDTAYQGSSKYFKKEDVVSKKILKTFATRLEALKHEIELHEEFDVGVNPKFANRCKAKATGFDPAGYKHPENVKAKMSEERRGDRHPMFGKKHREETKAKISEKARGRTGYMKGRKFSADYCAKRSGVKHSRADKTIYHFYNISGESFIGNRYDFAKDSGTKSSTVTNILKHPLMKNRRGWRARTI